MKKNKKEFKFGGYIFPNSGSEFNNRDANIMFHLALRYRERMAFWFLIMIIEAGILTGILASDWTAGLAMFGALTLLGLELLTNLDK